MEGWELRGGRRRDTREDGMEGGGVGGRDARGREGEGHDEGRESSRARGQEGTIAEWREGGGRKEGWMSRLGAREESNTSRGLSHPNLGDAIVINLI